MGAAMPSNQTRVPPAIVSSCPDAVGAGLCNVVGPMLAPKIVINSPGATAPGCRLAALTTPCGVNTGAPVPLPDVPCVTGNVCPAMVMLPVRKSLAPAVRATVYCTVPLPLPGLPVVTAIQEALLAACHRQPAVVFTVSAPPPPLLLNDALTGASVKAQFSPLEGAVTCAHHVPKAPVRFDGGVAAYS